MYVYCTTNMLTGIKYVGKCVKLPNKSEKYIGSGTYLQSAIRKYGKEYFCKEIIEYNIENKELLNLREQYWIKELNTKYPNGYNLTDGGDGCQGMTEKTKEKIRQTNKLKVGEKSSRYGKKNSKEHNEALRKSNLGKKHSEETKEKIGQSRKGQKRTPESIEKQRQYMKENVRVYTEERNRKVRENQPHALKVSQFTKDNVFIKNYPSAREAYRQTDVANPSISNCCKNKLKTAGGFIWRFTKEDNINV